MRYLTSSDLPATTAEVPAMISSKIQKVQNQHRPGWIFFFLEWQRIGHCFFHSRKAIFVRGGLDGSSLDLGASKELYWKSMPRALDGTPGVLVLLPERSRFSRSAPSSWGAALFQQERFPPGRSTASSIAVARACTLPPWRRRSSHHVRPGAPILTKLTILPLCTRVCHQFIRVVSCRRKLTVVLLPALARDLR